MLLGAAGRSCPMLLGAAVRCCWLLLGAVRMTLVDVFLYRAAVAELLAAEMARELLDARVVDEVSLQVRAAGEAARAVRTLVAVHAAVQVLVATQAAHTEETLRAERARVRPLRSLKLAGSPRRRRLKWKPALVNHRGDRRPANQSLPIRTQTIRRNLEC